MTEKMLEELREVVLLREARVAQSGNRPEWELLDSAFNEAVDRFIAAHHSAIEAAVRERDVLRSLAAAMYQAAGAYDMPVRFLDVLSAAGNGEPITEEQVDALLPCETPEFVRDKERLDWLESEANTRGGLLLHDGSESGRRGLGLRFRDLRTAIDQCAPAIAKLRGREGL